MKKIKLDKLYKGSDYKFIDELDNIIEIKWSNYNIKNVDHKKYDKIINPFDLNLYQDYPYKNEEKNKSCFLDIILNNNKTILLILKKTKTPSLSLMYEPFIKEDNTSDIEYNYILADDEKIIIAYGISLVILKANTLEIIKYKCFDHIDSFFVNITNKNNKYIIESIDNQTIILDSYFNEII